MLGIPRLINIMRTAKSLKKVFRVFFSTLLLSVVALSGCSVQKKGGKEDDPAKKSIRKDSIRKRYRDQYKLMYGVPPERYTEKSQVEKVESENDIETLESNEESL